MLLMTSPKAATAHFYVHRAIRVHREHGRAVAKFLSRTFIPRFIGSRSSQTCSNFPVVTSPSLPPPLPEPLMTNNAAGVGL